MAPEGGGAADRLIHEQIYNHGGKVNIKLNTIGWLSGFLRRI